MAEAMKLKRVGVLGSGTVGEVLAGGFRKHGYEVMRGSRDPAKLREWRDASGPSARTGTFEETAAFGDLVVLAVKGSAAEASVRQCAAEMAGKPVIDATNPIAEGPPVNGVLRFFTSLDESLMERLQRLAPAARFVKAFSCVGNAFMVDPDFGGVRPTMFICGNDPAAKEAVRAVLDRFGWETEDMGAVEAARAIEPLCILWCIPGLREGRWSHAFKLLRR
jgi:predicted dinucleotide-binding enzyme